MRQVNDDDATLLRHFLADRAAFAAIVDRYGATVRAAARRHVGDAHLADDVAQATFVMLARRASSIPANRSLAAWLLTTTRYVAMNARRQRDRARRRERAMAHEPRPTPNEDLLSEHGPLVDDALAKLGAADRDAIVWRYVDGLPLASIGARQGVSEEAARKRVGRAVERVRELLRRRGVNVGDVGGAMVAMNVGALSDAARESLMSATHAPVTSVAGALAEGTITTMTAGQLKSVTASIIVTLLAVGGVAGVVLRTPRDAASTTQQAATLATADPAMPSVRFKDEPNVPIGGSGARRVATMPTTGLAGPALDDVQRSVKFSDGTVAVLDGIRHVPGGDAPPSAWWRADGSIVDAAWPAESRIVDPFHASLINFNKGRRRAIEISVEISSPDTTRGPVGSVRLADVYVGGTSMSFGGPPGVGRYFNVFPIDASVQRAELQVGAAVGPAIVFESIAPGDAMATRAAGQIVSPPLIETIGESDGCAVVRFAADARVPAALREMNWNLVAYDLKGVGHLPDGSKIRKGEPALTFPLRLAEVRRVAYDYRPYEWRSLGTIRLAPTTTPATTRASE